MGLFDSFLGKKDLPSVLGVDIGSSAIKIVQIKKKNGQAVLETYGELALGPYGGGTIGQAVQIPTERLAEALTDLMKEKEVNVTTKLAGLSIPFASSLMSVMELPEVPAKELATMVPLEARKYIPVPINEVMLDWSVIPKLDNDEEVGPDAAPADKIKKTEVLVVAIHNDTIAKYQEIVAKAALEVNFFEIEIFSTMRAVIEEGLTPTMVMDMGAASTKLYVVERGVIKSSHTINRGAQDITSAISQSMGLTLERAEVLKRDLGTKGDKTVAQVISLVLESIFAEANRTLLGYEKKYGRTVSKVILVGGGAALKGLAELAKSAFKTEAVVGNPFAKLSTPAFIEKVLAQTGPEFAVAIGLALRRLQDL